MACIYSIYSHNFGLSLSLDADVRFPSFRDDRTSFMAFRSVSRVTGATISTRHRTSIALEIRPTHRDGLVIYSSFRQFAPFKDFISIGLYDGYVEFRYNLGSQTAIIKSADRLDLFQWHSIYASRKLQDGRNTRAFDLSVRKWYFCRFLGELIVDSGEPVRGKSLGSTQLLDVNNDVYVGGHEDYNKVGIRASCICIHLCIYVSISH